jgi:hypothetical protein
VRVLEPVLARLSRLRRPQRRPPRPTTVPAAFDDAGVFVDLEGSGMLAVEASTILG